MAHRLCHQHFPSEAAFKALKKNVRFAQTPRHSGKIMLGDLVDLSGEVCSSGTPAATRGCPQGWPRACPGRRGTRRRPPAYSTIFASIYLAKSKMTFASALGILCLNLPCQEQNDLCLRPGQHQFMRRASGMYELGVSPWAPPQVSCRALRRPPDGVSGADPLTRHRRRPPFPSATAHCPL